MMILQGLTALLLVGAGLIMGRAVYSQAPVGLAGVTGMLVITDRENYLYCLNLLVILALALISLLAQMGVNEMASRENRDTRRETLADLTGLLAGAWTVSYYLIASVLSFAKPSLQNIAFTVVGMMAIVLLTALAIRLRRGKQLNAARQPNPAPADTVVMPVEQE